jgi:transcriptional regulator with XRE-family HTH domain
MLRRTARAAAESQTPGLVPATASTASSAPAAAAATAGRLVRTWRLARHLSQEQLAERALVSTRHLSFVENGRSRPSPELLCSLCEALNIPLRERNTLLLAGGYAPAFSAGSLDGDELVSLRRAVDHILRQQEPYGAVVVDRYWNVLRLNQGAARLLSCFPPSSAAGAETMTNVLLATFHPGALRPYIVNWEEVAGTILLRLQREIATMPDDREGTHLQARLLALPGVPASWRTPDPATPAQPFVPLHLRHPSGLELRLFSLITTVGTPMDVTAEGLRIESYFPVDDASEVALRTLATLPME